MDIYQQWCADGVSDPYWPSWSVSLSRHRIRSTLASCARHLTVRSWGQRAASQARLEKAETPVGDSSVPSPRTPELRVKRTEARPVGFPLSLRAPRTGALKLRPGRGSDARRGACDERACRTAAATPLTAARRTARRRSSGVIGFCLCDDSIMSAEPAVRHSQHLGNDDLRCCAGGCPVVGGSRPDADTVDVTAAGVAANDIACHGNSAC